MRESRNKNQNPSTNRRSSLDERNRISRVSSSSYNTARSSTIRRPSERNAERHTPANASARTISQEERLKLREQNIKKRKRNSKIFRTAVIGIGGIIVIALLILILKSCTSENAENSSNSTPSNSATTAPSATITPSPTPMQTDIKSGSDLLDKLWAEAAMEEAELIAAEEEKKRKEEEEKILANTPTEEYAEEKSIKDLDITESGSMLLVGDSAHPFYKFNFEAANDFANALNKAPTDINVYSVITPSKIDIELPLKLLNEYPNETSDQRKAIRYINSLLNESINKVYVYDRMKAHCDEDLYFKGDSRSTSLASYYAYTLWAEKKGITPIKLENLEAVTYDNFKGNISLNHSAVCSSESITVYKSSTDFSFKLLNGSDMESWPVYANVADYSSPYKYSTFLMDCNNYGIITNNDIEDDSACIIIKDESGNSFAPFVAEHYKTTYVVDYRNYKGSIEKLISDSGAVDLIYFIPIINTNSSSTASKLAKLY